MRRVLCALVVTATLAGVPSAAMAKAPTDACHRGAAKGHMLARNGTGAVFSRGTSLYGCTYRHAKVRRLNVCCTDVKVKLAGRYAGYAATGSAIGDETTKLAVIDLRTGGLWNIRKLAPNSEGAGREIDTASFVSNWVVSSSGGMAWIAAVRHEDGTLGPEKEVRAAAHHRPWERVVDSGNVAKLRLREGYLTWTHDGVSRSATLDEGPFRGSCATLKGTKVLETATLRIVKVPTHSRAAGSEFVGHDYVGCALPNGLAHNLGDSGTTYLVDNGKRVGFYGSETETFRAPAGTFVLAEQTSGSNSFTADTTDVVDVTTGLGTTVAYYFDPGDGPERDGTVPIAAPLSAKLSASGVYAGVYGADPDGTGDGQHRVIAFTPLGAQRLLDTAPEADIPASSLAIDDTTVSWTNAGAPKSVQVTDG